MDIVSIISKELEVKNSQVEAAIKLIDEGNTIPFISRYRKEVTGSLNDLQLRTLFERLSYLRNLQDKKEQVLRTIEEQGKLTEEIRNEIDKATTLVAVEDIYRPFRPKRRTRGMVARERGLEALAKAIREQKEENIEKLASSFICEEKEILTVEDAISGAKDIIAEDIGDEADYRTWIRNKTYKEGLIISTGKNLDSKSVYWMYNEFSEKLTTIPGYRILAINRGENEKALTVKIEAPVDEIKSYFNKKLIEKDSTTKELMEEAYIVAYNRLIAPSIEKEIRNDLTEKAQEGAIKVFGNNLGALLMQQPISNKVVMGWDPAFRTGCKLAVVDGTGKVLATKVIFPTAPTTEAKIKQAKEDLKDLINKYNVELISLGNGTASRESEQIIVELLKTLDKKVYYVITNEAGASVYSASKEATVEFPTFDVGQRSAISIARRVQDPLAELVKIDPKAIGVGQYQHDMNQKRLGEALTNVVEDCVNSVGVDLNTASASLLEYVSGITKTVGKNIVAYREENGTFKNRSDLLKVPKLGPKAFIQCAGFLRINNGDNVLDKTGVHPESYEKTTELLRILGITTEDLLSGKSLNEKFIDVNIEEMSENLHIGEETLVDIINELKKPGRDPRQDMPAPILKADVMELEDLKEGMVLKGTVRNVIDFGAFVDIGVHQDGLVHISQLSDKYIKNPMSIVSVGDVVNVKVLSVDIEKKRIQLSMKGLN